MNFQGDFIYFRFKFSKNLVFTLKKGIKRAELASQPALSYNFNPI
jgi:hypothetical protein